MHKPGMLKSSHPSRCNVSTMSTELVLL